VRDERKPNHKRQSRSFHLVNAVHKKNNADSAKNYCHYPRCDFLRRSNFLIRVHIILKTQAARPFRSPLA